MMFQTTTPAFPSPHLPYPSPFSRSQKTTVIDSTGDWLTSFKSWTSKLGITHLNTPITLHPHASPGALKDFAQQQQQHTGCSDITISPSTSTPPKSTTTNNNNHSQPQSPSISATSRPSVSLFLDFCHRKIIQKLPQHLRKPIHATVTNITTNTAAGIISLSNGQHITTKAVIHTVSNTRPVIPLAFRGLLGGADGDRGEHSTASTVLTCDQVDFSSSSSSKTTNVSGKKIAIVGGGCTAVSLVINAIDHHHQEGGGGGGGGGNREDRTASPPVSSSPASSPTSASHVTLIVRGQLRQAWQDIDVGWWGPKYLNGYKQQPSPYHRMMTCRRARQQAVISPPQWNRLIELSLAGKVTVLEECEVQRCSNNYNNKRDNGSCTGGFVLDIISSNPNNKTNTSSTEFASSVVNSTTTTPQSIEVDTVWLACGSAYNASLDPLLSPSSLNRTTIVGGYPVVDDDTLALSPPSSNCSSSSSSSRGGDGGVPAVFILGRGAQVALGPAARDLAGWRLGAGLIVKALKTLEYYATGTESGGNSAGGKEMLPWSVRNKACDDNNNSNSNSKEEEEERLPLEEEGCRFDQGSSKRKPVACPPHLVNISDVSNDASIPKYEIQKYAFVDEGFKIKVYIDLDKHKNNGTRSTTTKVRSVLTERSIDVWALVEEEKKEGGVVIVAAYHLFIPLLYGRIIPGKSMVSVSSSSGNVRMSLQKIADGEWRFLKG